MFTPTNIRREQLPKGCIISHPRVSNAGEEICWNAGEEICWPLRPSDCAVYSPRGDLGHVLAEKGYRLVKHEATGRYWMMESRRHTDWWGLAFAMQAYTLGFHIPAYVAVNLCPNDTEETWLHSGQIETVRKVAGNCLAKAVKDLADTMGQLAAM